MQTRRSFFRRLVGAAASVAVAASVQCFGITDKIKPLKAIVNPAYATAAYEDVFFFSSGIVSGFKFPSSRRTNRDP